ncbi:MAG: S8 family serine peptidase, partial [Aggregatilineales bacterium]
MRFRFRASVCTAGLMVALAACNSNAAPTATSVPATNKPAPVNTIAPATAAPTAAAVAAAPTSASTLSAAVTAAATSILGQYVATDTGSNISIGPANATAVATAPALGTPDNAPISSGGKGGTPGGTASAVNPPTINPPPTLADLLKQFPDLQPYVNSAVDVSKMDSTQLADLYKKMVEVYNSKGASGLAVFLKDSHLLEKFNIPVSYLDLLMVYDKGGLDAVQKLAKQRGLINSNNEIVGLMTLASPDAIGQVASDLKALGVNAYPPLDTHGQLPIGIPLDTLNNYQSPATLIQFLIKVAHVNNVTAIGLPIPVTPAGKVNMAYYKGKGPQTIGATAWQKAGFTGKGVRIGVLDMGFGGLKALMNGKDLPTSAHLKTSRPVAELDAQQETHGTDCAQVVHGAAPDADLFLAYFDDEPSFQQALTFLLDNKVQIISYSIGSSIGPRDGTFGEATLVDKIVQKTGVLWVVAAGNEATDHSTFKYSDPVGDGQNHFDKKHNALPFVAGAPQTDVAMNWNGNWNGGETDEYDFSIVDSSGNEVASAAEPRAGGTNDLPFQDVSFASNPGDTYYMVITKANAQQDNTLDVFINNAELPKWARVPDHSVTTPADSSSAFAVGATILGQDQIEDFSSEGPTNGGLLKPDISAPDGEVLPDAPDGFFGTSGATPLVAGTAALVLQAYPKLSQAEVKAYLINNVADLGKPGPDDIFGAGRIKLPDPAGIDPNHGPAVNSPTPGPNQTPPVKKTPRPPKPTSNAP